MKKSFRSLEHTIVDVWLNEAEFDWGGYNVGVKRHNIVDREELSDELLHLDADLTEHKERSFAHNEQANRLKKQLPFVSEDAAPEYEKKVSFHKEIAALHDGVANALKALIDHKRKNYE